MADWSCRRMRCWPSDGTWGRGGLNLNSFEEQRNFEAAKVLFPLVPIIQVADYMAASILEKDAGKVDEL